MYDINTYNTLPGPMAALSKKKFYDWFPGEIVGPNPARGMNVFHFGMLYFVR
jgi:hypothetical protein